MSPMLILRLVSKRSTACCVPQSFVSRVHHLVSHFIHVFPAHLAHVFLTVIDHSSFVELHTQSREVMMFVAAYIDKSKKLQY